MPLPARSYHKPCIYPPGHTIYHVMPTRPHYILCHIRQAIPYAREAITHTMPCPPVNTQVMPYTTPCPPRPYHIPCHAHQAIPYTSPYLQGHTIYHALTMLCPPGHTTYPAMPSRPYHIPCHARQTIPYTMSCPPGHTIYHAMSVGDQVDGKGPKDNVTRCPILISVVKEDDSFLWKLLLLFIRGQWCIVGQ